MSFLRHGEIYHFDEGAIPADHALAHRNDEFPAGYSLAGCTPAEPASASPAGAHFASKRLRSTIQFQRTANSVLTVCLTPGDNPSCFLSLQNSKILLAFLDLLCDLLNFGEKVSFEIRASAVLVIEDFSEIVGCKSLTQHRPLFSAELVCNFTALLRFPSIQAAEFRNNSALPKRKGPLVDPTEPACSLPFPFGLLSPPV